jgi:hypothetical protein
MVEAHGGMECSSGDEGHRLYEFDSAARAAGAHGRPFRNETVAALLRSVVALPREGHGRLGAGDGAPWGRTELMNSREAEQGMPLDQFVTGTMPMFVTDSDEILAERARLFRANVGPNEQGSSTHSTSRSCRSPRVADP